MQKLLIILPIFLMTSVWAQDSESICTTDKRVPSNNPKVAKLVKSPGDYRGCSGVMISPRCMISAGHCTRTRMLRYAQFDIDGHRRSKPADLFEVDDASRVSMSSGKGRDFAVFKLKPNKITGRLAGNQQGYYRVSLQEPSRGDWVRMYGYAKSENNRIDYYQSLSSGQVLFTHGSLLGHRADSTSGNSGSGIYHLNSESIIGVHTHGGCQQNAHSSNHGTLIGGNQFFKKAVLDCLKSDGLLLR